AETDGQPSRSAAGNRRGWWRGSPGGVRHPPLAGHAAASLGDTVLMRHLMADERMHEACGLFGIDAPGEAVANLTKFGLYALQHRGQESAGIATSDGHAMRMHKDMGLVAQAFDADALERLTGHLALGHTRYSTTGSNRLENAQPIIVEHPQLGSIAIAHNGNLTNTQLLHADLEQHGVRFKTSSDTE